MNGTGRLAYPERLSMRLQTCWREKEDLSEIHSVRSNDENVSGSHRAAITAKQFCSFSLGENLSGCSGISKTAVWKKCGR